MNSDNSEKWTPQQLRFMEWLALPKAERKPTTHLKFAAEIGVHQDTLTNWKRLPGFIDDVNALAREFVKYDIPEVLGVIRKEAKKANLPYVNMVLAMAGMSGDIEAAGKGPGSLKAYMIVSPDDWDSPTDTTEK